MSVVCTIAAATTVAISSGVLSGIVTAVGAHLGLKLLAAGSEGQAEGTPATEEVAGGDLVEVSIATGAALQQVVAERCHLVLGGEGITLTVDRDIRGRLTVRAHGEGLTRVQVQEQAAKLLGLVLQQVAYREVVRTMKANGLQVQGEERTADGVVRVRIGRAR